MRVALLSDIHGNLPALEAVVDDVRRRGTDQIVCLGDNVSGPLLPRETAQYLMGSGWLVLAGNHERQVLSYTAVGGGASDGYAHSQLTAAELSWIGSLQPTANLSTDIFLCHGTPRSDCEHFLESPRGGLLGLASSADIVERLGGVRAQLIACGHSHVPRSVRLPSGQLIVNPGSVGLQAYTDDHPEPYRMELGTPDAHYAIVERTPTGWRAAHHAVPYDSEPVAKLAMARNRAEWQSALLKGYVP
jgi:predicted phosphodiesterase